MRYLMVLASLLLLGGCMKISDMGEAVSYQLSDAGLLDHSDIQRTAPWRIQADSFIYIAQAHYQRPGSTELRPNLLADEAFKAFVEYFPQVRRSVTPQSLDQALAEARNLGANYVLYARVAGASDRIGSLEQWEEQGDLGNLGLDRSVLQLSLIDAGSGSLIDSVTINNRAGLFSLFNNHPSDQLQRPLLAYARKLLGVSER